MKKADKRSVVEYSLKAYGVSPDYPWDDDPSFVLRHKDNRKWFALIMEVAPKRLGLEGDSTLDVLNVKCSPMMLGSLLEEKGFLPAYHMSKSSWISILLDGSVDCDKVFSLIDMSYGMTESKSRKSGK